MSSFQMSSSTPSTFSVTKKSHNHSNNNHSNVAASKKNVDKSQQSNPSAPSTTTKKDKEILEYKLFDVNMTTQYRIPTSAVVESAGKTQYDRHERTPHWLKKQRSEESDDKHPVVFTLCNAYQHHTCTRGDKCRYVHASLEAPGVQTLTIHSKKTSLPYTLPAGTPVPIIDRAAGTTSIFRSEQILVTKGSSDWFSMTPAARRKIFHCTHFHAEGMCLRGPECVFLHVLDDEAPQPIRVPRSSSPSTASPMENSLELSARSNPGSDCWDQGGVTSPSSPLNVSYPQSMDSSRNPSMTYSNVSSGCPEPNCVYCLQQAQQAQHQAMMPPPPPVQTAARGARMPSFPTELAAPSPATYTHNPYGPRVLSDEGYLYSSGVSHYAPTAYPQAPAPVYPTASYPPMAAPYSAYPTTSYPNHLAYSY